MPLDLPFSQGPPFDAAKTHRWLAIEFNNIAWDLFDRETELNCEEIERMIHIAHASRLHWSLVGKPINDLRGELLIAHTYGRARLAEATQRHAQKCLELAKTCADEIYPFDEALMYGVAAWGETLGGNDDQAAEYLKKAHAAAANMTDEDSKRLFEKYVAFYQKT
ncbi:MAG: hypothetical protein O2955_12690 [Planctomycetota bacterium]|nr:hypothetical protein [Planctomycetota bacterium]MDA1213367.1 hypothetical protein [Planctomycetota bacterium]